MVLLVNMDKFDPNHVLVNVNKLKPYVPYDNNTKGLVFKFQGGRREGTIVEKQESSKDSMKGKGKDKVDEGKGTNKKKHMIPNNLIFH